jgi:tRNA (guanine10-N2)-dimethyltransferase
VLQFFFLLSGEHPTLPFAELKAILEAEGIAHKERQRLPQVIRLDTTPDVVEALKRRAALTRTCCREILHCEAALPEIMKAIQATPIDSLLKPDETFAVRVRQVGEKTGAPTSIYLERKLGELILEKTEKARVNLEQPQKTFFGTITGDSFTFGLRLAEIPATPFMQRRPRKRPFFHPSAMPPKLARCMVNLAKPKSGELLIDPFCGTGSFLIEAGLIGCRVVGSDAKRYVVRGCRRNLKFLNVKYEGLAAADAKRLPFTKADCVVTDPPYGRSASTMGYTTGQIIQEFLAGAVGNVKKGQRMCLAAPKTVNIRETAENLGLKCTESHLVYVHRSLTREIVVLEDA